MMARFCRYVDKVFHFGELIGMLHDSRVKPMISTAAVWSSAFFMFATRRGSLNAAEADWRMPRPAKALLGPQPPSADTVGRVFTQMDSDELRQMLCRINHQLKRNKALATSGPLVFAAVDGHEFFASRHRHCSECLQRTLEIGGVEVVEYYHRGVACHLIGFDLPLPLDVEMLRPGEGEVVAAKRLLERVFQSYGRFFDAIVGDGIYMEAPFFNFCLEHGKDVLAVLKDDRRLLLQDAQGLFAQMPPQECQDGRRSIRYWDVEGFTSAEGVQQPLRVLHTEETETVRTRVKGEWIHKTETHSWYWASTIKQEIASSRWLWHAGHHRWDIENDLFNTLATHWGLDHCFKHDAKAILNFVLTLFTAFVLMESFFQRNLKQPCRARLTLIGLAGKLYQTLTTTEPRVPWYKSLLPLDTS